MIEELIKLIPSVLWLTLVVVVFCLLYRPLRYEVLPKLTGIKIGEISLSFVGESIDAALVLAEKRIRSGRLRFRHEIKRES